MKLRVSIFIVSFAIISLVIFSHSKITSGVYDFPIKPGTSEWRELNDHNATIDACQIPEGILLDMSTIDLLVTILNYPNYNDIHYYNDKQKGLERIENSFNGFREFRSRTDKERAFNRVSYKLGLVLFNENDIQNRIETLRDYFLEF